MFNLTLRHVQLDVSHQLQTRSTPHSLTASVSATPVHLLIGPIDYLAEETSFRYPVAINFPLQLPSRLDRKLCQLRNSRVRSIGPFRKEDGAGRGYVNEWSSPDERGTVGATLNLEGRRALGLNGDDQLCHNQILAANIVAIAVLRYRTDRFSPFLFIFLHFFATWKTSCSDGRHLGHWAVSSGSSG